VIGVTSPCDGTCWQSPSPPSKVISVEGENFADRN
jgi:hypothetical protein